MYTPPVTLPPTVVAMAPIAEEFNVVCVFVAKSCEPLMASVEDEERLPAATLVIVRSAPDAPTLTVEDGLVPAKA